MVSQIPSPTIVYSTVCSRHRSKKTQSSAPLALCEGNSPVTVNSPHKGSVTQKMIPFDDVIMYWKGSQYIWNRRPIKKYLNSSNKWYVSNKYPHNWKRWIIHVDLIFNMSGSHFKNTIFDTVLLFGISRSSYDNVLRWMPRGFTDEKSTLIQIVT